MINSLLQTLLLPPGINLILILVGLLLIKKYNRAALSLIIISICTLLLLSLPAISHSLSRSIEPEKILSFAEIKATISNKNNNSDNSFAIVVISAGRQRDAFEYGNIDVSNAESLQRLSYASWLFKKLDLPILLTGENALNEATAESVLLNQAMISNFSITPLWIESDSENMADIAENVSLFLKSKSITNIVLVTHAREVLRSRYVFQKHGLDVIAAPIAYSINNSTVNQINFYMPSAKALFESTSTLKEIITLIWYQVRY